MAAATPAVPTPGLGAPAATTSPADRSKDRWGYAAVAAVALFVAGPILLGGSTPDTSDGAAKIQSFYADHATKEILAGIGMGFSGVAFLVFGSALLRSLRRVAGTDASWPWLAFGGSLVLSIGLMIGGGVQAILANDAKHLSPAAASAINSVAGAPYMAVLGGLGVLTLGVIAATWGARAIPRWMAWVGIVLAVFTMTPVGWIIGLGTFAWLIGLGVMIATRGLRLPQQA